MGFLFSPCTSSLDHHLSRLVYLPWVQTIQNINVVDQSKVEYLSIGAKTWFPEHTRFRDIILQSLIQGFQNLIILSYNPFILNVSGSHPFETHPTLQSVRHYIEIPRSITKVNMSIRNSRRDSRHHGCNLGTGFTRSGQIPQPKEHRRGL
jgi:hypothetical protein